MSEFFHMGGYGFFVWVSYAVAAVILIGNIVLPKYQHRSIIKNLTKKIIRAEKFK